MFWETISFVKNLEMTQIAGGRGVMFFRHYDTVRTKMDMWFTSYIKHWQVNSRMFTKAAKNKNKLSEFRKPFWKFTMNAERTY